MLNHVAALVGRHGRGGDGTAVVHVVAQVHGLGLRVVMVRESAFHGNDFHVMDAMGLQHTLGDLGPGEGGGNLLVFLETVFQAGLDEHAQHHDRDHQDPNH